MPSTETDDDSVRSVLRKGPAPEAKAVPARQASARAQAPTQADSGTTPTPPALLPPAGRASNAGGLVGKTLGRFQFISELGRGASGSVFLAQHLTLGIPVAVKVLSSQLAMLDARHIERFQQEARAAMRLSHPGIVRVHDLDLVDGLYLIVMEYVDGMTVADHIKLSGAMPESLALVVTKGVAEALEAALEERIIHRDVKPANIMLTKTRRVKLADLGLAKALGSGDRLGETGVNAILGTPHYFSPEQARDAASVDHRADIYSLGCTLYHMLTGHVPYQGSGLSDVIRQHESAPIPDARAERPELSRRAADLARWMMAKDVSQRPQDYATVINAIQRCIVDPEPEELHAASAGSPRTSGILRRFITNVLGDEKPTRA